ncbi:hypothetical protein ACP70R_050128 [Stipagrostis hirtigluma subsp. patula]
MAMAAAHQPHKAMEVARTLAEIAEVASLAFHHSAGDQDELLRSEKENAVLRARLADDHALLRDLHAAAAPSLSVACPPDSGWVEIGDVPNTGSNGSKGSWVFVSCDSGIGNLEESSGIDNESYVIVNEDDIVDGIASFVARCIIEDPKSKVAVALSHAAILEESMRARDLLMEQNLALDLARREAEMAIRARNDFLAVMNHEMRTPMSAIIALSSLLLETELTPEQRLMVETVWKSSNLLATLINDVLDLSKLEDGSLQLEFKAFNLHAVFKEVMSFIKPIASIKKLSVSAMLSPDLPLSAIGDEKRLMQTILNICGNAVKYTKDGHISLLASIVKSDSLKDLRNTDFHPVVSDGHFYLKVQVKDTGCGISPQDLPRVFTKFADAHSEGDRGYDGSGLGLAICKRFVSLMEGHIWLDSEGVGKGCTATFVVKLGACDNNAYQQPLIPLAWPSHGDSDSSGPTAPKEDRVLFSET